MDAEPHLAKLAFRAIEPAFARHLCKAQALVARTETRVGPGRLREIIDSGRLCPELASPGLEAWRRQNVGTSTE